LGSGKWVFWVGRGKALQLAQLQSESRDPDARREGRRGGLRKIMRKNNRRGFFQTTSRKRGEGGRAIQSSTLDSGRERKAG